MNVHKKDVLMSDKDISAIRIGIVLLDRFPLMAYASVVEPFRAANQLSERKLYEWFHLAPSGHDVRASNGVVFRADHDLQAGVDFDIVFVCAGGNPMDLRFEDLKPWLRRMDRSGCRIGGVSAGPFVLAAAGLLDGYRCTIHWDHMPAFIETFPHLRVEGGLYVIDRTRLTCAGGIAGLDLAINIIAEDHGFDLAGRVRDWYISSEVREGDSAQRKSLRERYNIRHEGLIKVLAYMEVNIEEPAPRQTLAMIAGVSVRQLDRLFDRHLGQSVADFYHHVRLVHARHLLHETTMPVTEVALASGYANAQHFSRKFKELFGLSPSKL